MEERLIGLLKSEYVFSHVKFNTKHKRSMTTLASLVIKRSSFIYYAPARRKGQVSVAFVCPSVCLSVSPSVAYIPNNLRTQRPSVPKFRMKVPHLWCDSHTNFKVKRYKVKVTMTINVVHWLSCDADTSATYLPSATYRITLVGVFLGHFCINLRQTRTQNSNEGLQHYNAFWKIAFQI